MQNFLYIEKDGQGAADYYGQNLISQNEVGSEGKHQQYCDFRSLAGSRIIIPSGNDEICGYHQGGDGYPKDWKDKRIVKLACKKTCKCAKNRN